MTTEATETETEEETEEPAAIDRWIDLRNEMKNRQEAVGGDAFLKKLSTESAKTTRAELRDWIYGYLVRTAETSALAASDVDDLADEIGELREELERLGNLTRAIASTNFFALVQRLVMLVQTRVQDPEVLQAAQIVAALFTPAVPQVQAVSTAPSAEAPTGT